MMAMDVMPWDQPIASPDWEKKSFACHTPGDQTSISKREKTLGPRKLWIYS